MPDSQSREPAFEYPLKLLGFVTISKLGNFVLSIDAPVHSAVFKCLAIQWWKCDVTIDRFLSEKIIDTGFTQHRATMID